MSATVLFSIISIFLAAPGGPSAAAPNPAKAADSALPGVNLKGLEKQELEALHSLLSDGACPCNPKVTLKTCIQDKTCKDATVLANFGADKFREGLGIEEVNEKVIRKYIEDFVRYNFDLVKSPRKGSPTAKIVMVEFADFECPHCAEMKTIVNNLLKRFPNDLAVVFKQFPLPHHRFSKTAALAALASHQQGKFWQMHDLIFQNQGKLTDAKFVDFAKELGINVVRFKADMAAESTLKRLRAEQQEAMQANISGTPAIYINGRAYSDEKSEEKLAAYIAKMIDPSAPPTTKPSAGSSTGTKAAKPKTAGGK